MAHGLHVWALIKGVEAWRSGPTHLNMGVCTQKCMGFVDLNVIPLEWIHSKTEAASYANYWIFNYKLIGKMKWCDSLVSSVDSRLQARLSNMSQKVHEGEPKLHHKNRFLELPNRIISKVGFIWASPIVRASQMGHLKLGLLFLIGPVASKKPNCLVIPFKSPSWRSPFRHLQSPQNREQTKK